MNTSHKVEGNVALIQIMPAVGGHAVRVCEEKR